jgi:cephalosporin hydroxylase
MKKIQSQSLTTQGIAIIFGAVCSLAASDAMAQSALTVEQARYEAQKLFTILKRNHPAAFMDNVLADRESYDRLFSNGIGSAMKAAPVTNNAFAPYRICHEAAKNIMKFAELRKLGGKQNAQSDEYRRSFWDAYSACEKKISEQ